MVGCSKVEREQNPSRLFQFFVGTYAQEKGINKTTKKFRSLSISKAKYYKKKGIFYESKIKILLIFIGVHMVEYEKIISKLILIFIQMFLN